MTVSERFYTTSRSRRLLNSLLLMIIGTVYSDNVSSVSIPDDIYELCPYSHICNRNASLPIINTKTYRSCCDPCSCDPDCGLSLNCCFDHLDTYRIVEKFQLACVNPVTNLNLSINPDSEYFMVDRCRNETKSGTGGVIKKSCRTGVSANGNNGIAPVSSPNTGLTYFNAKCAECNDVYAYDLWQVKVLCLIRTGGSHSWTLQLGLMNNACSFVYSPPPKLNGIDKMRCHSNMQGHCLKHNHPLEGACQNLNAPFIAPKLLKSPFYSNVYCAKCSTNVRIDAGELCLKSYGKNSANDISFSTLIDTDTIKNISYLKDLVQDRSPHISSEGICHKDEVIHPHKNECRMLYCPDGMVRTKLGCRYFGIKVDATAFATTLKLMPSKGNDLMRTYLNELSDKQRKRPSLWIHNPCSIRWSFIRVYASTPTNNTDDEDIVKSIVLKLLKETTQANGFQPAVVISRLRDCLDGEWIIKLAGRNLRFKADFYRYKVFVPDGKMKLLNGFEFPPPDKLYDIVAQYNAVSSMGFFGTVFITKLHYCQQVRLSLSDVEESNDEIRIRSHGLVLGDNEFLKLEPFGSESREPVFAICVEDFNYAWFRAQQTNVAVGSVLCHEQQIAFITFFVLVFV